MFNKQKTSKSISRGALVLQDVKTIALEVKDDFSIQSSTFRKLKKLPKRPRSLFSNLNILKSKSNQGNNEETFVTDVSDGIESNLNKVSSISESGFVHEPLSDVPSDIPLRGKSLRQQVFSFSLEQKIEENNNEQIKRQLYTEHNRQQRQNNVMFKLRRRLSTGDISKKENDGKKNKKNRNGNDETSGIGIRSNSMDNVGKSRWISPLFKRRSPLFRRKKETLEISDAELLSFTYTGSPELISTLERKKKSSIKHILEANNDLHDITENIDEVTADDNYTPVKINEVISQPIEHKDVNAEDMNALRELLLNLAGLFTM